MEHVDALIKRLDSDAPPIKQPESTGMPPNRFSVDVFRIELARDIYLERKCSALLAFDVADALIDEAEARGHIVEKAE